MTSLAERTRDERGRLVAEWSDEDTARVRELFDAGVMDLAIAAEFGCSRTSVTSLRARLGWRRRSPIVLDTPPGWKSGFTNGQRKYWTDQRVSTALRDYARQHAGQLPVSTKVWDGITRGVATLPVSERVLAQFGALGNAWRALLPADEFRARVRLQWVRYTEAEDEYITRNAGRMPMSEIARYLNRTEASITAHAQRDLGVAYMQDREWWLPREVAEHYGCPVNRVRRLIDDGLLPAEKRGGYVQVDVRFLRGVASDYDERYAVAELGAERLAALEAALRLPNQNQKRPTQLRRHTRPGHNDVITRVPQGAGLARRTA